MNKEAVAGCEKSSVRKYLRDIDYIKLIFAFKMDPGTFNILFSPEDKPNWADEFDLEKESWLLRVAVKLIEFNMYITDMDIYQVYRLSPEMYYEYPSLKMYETINLGTCKKIKLEDCGKERFYATISILVYAIQFWIVVFLFAFTSLAEQWFDPKKLACPAPTENEFNNLFYDQDNLNIATRLYCFFYNVSSKHKLDTRSRIFFYAYAFYFLFTRKMNYFTKTSWFPKADMSEIRFLLKPKAEISRIDAILRHELGTIKKSLKYWRSNLIHQYNNAVNHDDYLDFSGKMDDSDQNVADMLLLHEQQHNLIERTSDPMRSPVPANNHKSLNSITRRRRSEFHTTSLFSSNNAMIKLQTSDTITRTKQEDYLSKWFGENKSDHCTEKNLREPQSKSYCLLKLMAKYNEREIEGYENDLKVLRPDTYSQAWHSSFKRYASHCTIVAEVLYHMMTFCIAISFILMIYYSECGSYYCPEFGLFSGENIIIITEITSFIAFSIQVLSVSTSLTFVSMIAYTVAIQKLEFDLIKALDQIRMLRRNYILMHSVKVKLKKHLQKQTKLGKKILEPTSHSRRSIIYLKHEKITQKSIIYGHQSRSNVVNLYANTPDHSRAEKSDCRCSDRDLDKTILEANGVLFKTFIKLNVSLLELRRSSHTIGELLLPSLATFFMTSMQVAITEAIGMTSGRAFRLFLMTVAWYALNLFLCIFAKFSSRINRLEPICWSILSEHIYLMKLTRPDIVGQDFTSSILSRLVFSLNHARDIYSPRPLGISVNYQKILEQNFFVISLVSIFFSR